MDPNSSVVWLSGAAIVFFLIVTAVAAAAETVLTSLNQAQLRALVADGVPRSSAIDRLLDDPHRSMVALLILNGLGLIGSASAATILSLHLAQRGWVEFLVLLAITLLLIALAQIVPKSWAAGRPEPVVVAVAGPVNIMGTVLWPLVWVFDFLSRGVNRLAGGEARSMGRGLMMSEEELRMLVGAGDEQGLIEEEEKEMIAGIFELADTLAREVMVPRISIVALDMGTPLVEALDTVIQAGHSRIPVYDGNIDNIVGILYAKDLLVHLRNGRREIELKEVVRQPLFIPETKHVDELLQELQQRRVHMAIVVDEYGGTAGLVTIEDLIEEIVGEIQDEYDTEEPFIEEISEDEVIFNARVDLDDVNRLMSLNLPTEHGDTLGGLVFSELGKIPAPGDRVSVDGVTIEVMSVVGRRIKKVRVTRDSAPEDGSGEDVEVAVDPRDDRSGSTLRDVLT